MIVCVRSICIGDSVTFSTYIASLNIMKLFEIVHTFHRLCNITVKIEFILYVLIDALVLEEKKTIIFTFELCDKK